MADLDIAEVNKMRVALGMAPLPTPTSTSSDLQFKPSSGAASAQKDEEDIGSTLETREAAGFDNWKKLQDDADEKKRKEARRLAIKKERDAAQRFAKLEGKGLGDVPETDEMDTKAWLLGQAKRQKKIAKARQRQIEQELAERENQAQYTEKDLAGLRVGHELGDFEAGTEQIITLQDRAVDADDDEEDVLENADLRAKEKLDERLQLKKKKPVYDPNDVDESGERKLLAQYDDELEGKKQKKFTLDGMGRTVEELAEEASGASVRPQGMKFSLDFLTEDKPAVSDYMDISEIKVKKPKKKKDKAKRQKTEDDMFDIGDMAQPPVRESMQVDSEVPAGASAVSTTERRFEDSLMIDDDDLQSTLASQRRAALKKRKMRPEDLAQQLREEASATPMDTTEGPEEEGGLIIDETSEFVANLQKPEAPIAKTKTKQENSPPPQPTVERDEEPDVDMDNREAPAYANEDTGAEAALQHIKREASTPAAELTTTGLDEESTISQGLGSTLAMLTQRGLLKTAGSGDLNAQHRERQRFLAEKQQRENQANARAKAQRERDRASGKFDRMSVKEREQYAQWENKQRDQQDSRQMAEIFNREYQPNVELNYVDEHGRRMNQREAFKFLSHQFHGKGSGKQKTEKRLKKIEDELKREAKSSLDSSEASGMSAVGQGQIKKARQAGIRLQ